MDKIDPQFVSLKVNNNHVFIFTWEDIFYMFVQHLSQYPYDILKHWEIAPILLSLYNTNQYSRYLVISLCPDITFKIATYYVDLAKTNKIGYLKDGVSMPKMYGHLIFRDRQREYLQHIKNYDIPPKNLHLIRENCKNVKYIKKNISHFYYLYHAADILSYDTIKMILNHQFKGFYLMGGQTDIILFIMKIINNNQLSTIELFALIAKIVKYKYDDEEDEFEIPIQESTYCTYIHIARWFKQCFPNLLDQALRQNKIRRSKYYSSNKYSY